jgi:uncharacterized protein (DUF983 family)
MLMEICPNCGGTILGDGYTVVQHCEFADYDKYYDKEPDSNTILCEIDDDK